MLRDAGEAQRHRIDALERELADARREIEEMRPRAERTQEAEARVAALDREVASLRAQLAPGRRARLGAFAIVIAVAGTLLAGVATYSARQIEAERLRAALEGQNAMHELDALRQRHAAELAELDARMREAEARASREGERAIDLAGELDREHAVEAELRREHTFVARELASRRVRVSGRGDLGSSCTVALSPNGGECRARVTCGGVEIYPAPGHGGYFTCDVEHGHLVRGRDVNPTPVSGDPTLAVDGPAGTVVVTDGPNPAWEVRIDVEPL